MYEYEILSRFREMPIFSLADINQIIDNRDYAKKFLKRMLTQKKIFRITRNKYTLFEDYFLLSTLLVKPSYITSISALYYYHMTSQISNKIFCSTLKNPQNSNLIKKIIYTKTPYFFGFEDKEYNSFKIPIADPEKAIIDSISVIPLSLIEESLENIDQEKMIKYLKKIKKSSIIKRVGYLLDKNNIDIYEKLKSYINYKYILLDPLSSKKGEKIKKWGIIDNLK